MRRVAGVAALVLVLVVLVVLAAAPLGACGGLVGENGTIQLTRTTTLAARGRWGGSLTKKAAHHRFTAAGCSERDHVQFSGPSRCSIHSKRFLLSGFEPSTYEAAVRRTASSPSHA